MLKDEIIVEILRALIPVIEDFKYNYTWSDDDAILNIGHSCTNHFIEEINKNLKQFGWQYSYDEKTDTLSLSRIVSLMPSDKITNE